MDRLYVIVRDDLRPGQQMAQAVHAAHSFAYENPEGFRAWLESSGYLVCLSVPNEDGLYELITRAIDHDISYHVFREADLADSITAISLQPGNVARQLCQNLPLALRGSKEGPESLDFRGSEDPDLQQLSSHPQKGNRWPA